jgi:hypothetical protein
MRFAWIIMALMVLTSSATPLWATPPPYTSKATTLEVLVEGKTLRLPATLKTRRLPTGERYNTDFVLDADLRTLYTKLPKLITGVKKNSQGQTIRIANVRCSYANGRIIIRSSADYRQAITSGLDLEQTLHSTIALFPEFINGVLRINYEVREAAFEGLTQGLLAATGTDPRAVVKTLFDIYFKDDLTYPLPKPYQKVPIQKKELRLYARDGKFYGLRTSGSARLSEAQYKDLLQQYF